MEDQNDIKQKIEDVKDKAEEKYEDVKDDLQDSKRDLREKVGNQPLKYMQIALGIGVVIGIALFLIF